MFVLTNPSTGFIDWEFSGLVPSWVSDPTKFMVYEPSAPSEDTTIKEKRPMSEIWPPIFKKIVEEQVSEVCRDGELKVPEELVYVEQVRTHSNSWPAVPMNLYFSCGHI